MDDPIREKTGHFKAIFVLDNHRDGLGEFFVK